MRVVITLTLLFSSLIMHVGAFNDLATRSVHSHFPFLAGNAIVDMNGMSDRILQIDEVDCPICGRKGLPLLPNVIVGVYQNVTYTCGMVNSNEFFTDTYKNEFILPKCARHQSDYEELCCDMPEPSPESLSRHECEENVLNELLEPGYRTSIMPLVGRERWVSVDTLVKLYGSSEISITDSTVEMNVEIVLMWNDPRLAWNHTAEKTCATSTFVRASLDAELTDIWVPSLDLLNRKEGVQDFAQAPAQIYSDGTVVWYRGGKISAFCTFVGLRRMPFDNLGCRFLFGDYLNTIYYNLVEVNDGPRGVQYTNYTRTYSEYTMDENKTTSTNLGGNFGIELYFTRARRHYTYLVIVPTILFVYISFGQFFHDATSGERVAFSINALLIVVAQNIITASLLPFCEERIWLNDLTTSCQVFVLVGIFEALFLYSLVERKEKKPDNSESDSYNIITPDETSESIIAAHKPAEIMRIPLRFRKTWMSLRKRLLKIMLLVDSMALFLLPLAFTLYLIIKFTTLDNYNDDPNVVWQL